MSTYLKDLGERVLFTAAGAFLAVYSVDSGIGGAKAGLIAAAAAALSLVKGVIAKYTATTTDTASFTV